MNNIPKKLRAELGEDPYYQTCSRNELLHDHECEGRITWEHALIYAGKQIQARFAIIPLCEWAHLGAGLIKSINIAIAMHRATPEDIEKYPLLPWRKYGMIEK